MRWLFNCLLARALGGIALLVLVAASINLVGIRVAGDVAGWNRWLEAHAFHFLIWRLCLYSATVYGWIWMRHHLRARDTSAEMLQRLRRAALGAVAAIVLLEVSMLWRQP